MSALQTDTLRGRLWRWFLLQGPVWRCANCRRWRWIAASLTFARRSDDQRATYALCEPCAWQCIEIIAGERQVKP